MTIRQLIELLHPNFPLDTEIIAEEEFEETITQFNITGIKPIYDTGGTTVVIVIEATDEADNK